MKEEFTKEMKEKYWYQKQPAQRLGHWRLCPQCNIYCKFIVLSESQERCTECNATMLPRGQEWK